MGFIRLIRRMNIWAILVLALLFAGVGVVGFFHFAKYVNTDPSQCANCHPQMTALWKRSIGHPADKVTCFECHAAHVEETVQQNLLVYYRDRLIPEKYMASTDRLEFHCLRCHKEAREAATEKKKIIKVNHKVHLEKPIPQDGRDIKLGCVDCHVNIAHDKAEEETNRPTMMSCFVARCHQKERNRDFCEKCHYQKLEELEKWGINPPEDKKAAAK